MASSTSSSPTTSRRFSSTSSESSLRDLEMEYESLRDEHLPYEEDVQFHTFIDALDRVESLIFERIPQAERRKSFSRLLTGFKMRKDKMPESTEPTEN
ncbi:hypothetical protein FZEAL_8502 [Fusarium zealandicum]|uniref:Uncharacterized protein n=1 Tax=Fusarium zealandicum TaxID=1053134 RepID=A0A8H4UDW4_9HYPO|nr:hypothetical protein FZEAL_8502 [Fusarium zealandicum]